MFWMAEPGGVGLPKPLGAQKFTSEFQMFNIQFLTLLGLGFDL